MDAYTFGRHRAAINLAEILSQQPDNVCKKASRSIHGFFTDMWFVFYKLRQNKRTLHSVMRLLYVDKKAQISKSKWPDVVKSHALNVVSGQYRYYLRLAKAIGI